MRWIATYAGSLIVILLNLPAAAACPFCESETGQQVKAGIFNDHFWLNVLLTLLPFPILLAIVALIYFDVPWRWKQTRTSAKAAAPSTASSIIGE
jgi:hypothetical protein